MRTRRAFSLVEVMVVIGIIAVLIAILLPVVNRSRAHANRVVCMSNLRQLLLAEQMYASESRGFLTYPNWGPDDYSIDVWPNGWLYSQGKTSTPLNQDDVKSGVLWTYVGKTEVYHCPVHLYENDNSAQGTDLLTSYIMNGAVCGFGTIGSRKAEPVVWQPSWKITEFTRPSEQIMMWEAEEYGRGGAPWNDGASYPRENLLAKRHGRGASVGFFDSHVEWMDRLDFTAELGRPGPNRLYCDPHRADGGKSL